MGARLSAQNPFQQGTRQCGGQSRLLEYGDSAFTLRHSGGCEFDCSGYRVELTHAREAAIARPIMSANKPGGTTTLSRLYVRSVGKPLRKGQLPHQLKPPVELQP